MIPFGCLLSNKFGVTGASDNLSRSTATNSISFLEVSCGPIDLQICVMARPTAANHIGAFCLRNCGKPGVERYVLANCSHGMTRFEAA
jgi:hypothetical protein